MEATLALCNLGWPCPYREILHEFRQRLARLDAVFFIFV